MYIRSQSNSEFCHTFSVDASNIFLGVWCRIQWNICTSSEASGGFRGGANAYITATVWVHQMIMQESMACSNNNQAQLHTHVSIPYWSPDIWLGLELLQGIQFGLPAILNNSLASYQSVATIITCVMNALMWTKVGMTTQKFSGVLCVPVAEPPFKFIDLPLEPQWWKSSVYTLHGSQDRAILSDSIQ